MLDGNRVKIANYAFIFGIIVTISNLINEGIDYLTIISIVFTVISFFSRFKILQITQWLLPLILGVIIIFLEWEGSWGYIFIYIFFFSILDIYNLLTKKVYILTIIVIALFIIPMAWIKTKNIFSSLSVLSLNIFMYQIINLRYKIKEAQIKEKETKKLKDQLQIKTFEKSKLEIEFKKLFKLAENSTEALDIIVDELQKIRNINYTKEHRNDDR